MTGWEGAGEAFEVKAVAVEEALHGLSGAMEGEATGHDVIIVVEPAVGGDA